jgi:hypothetical protein
MNNDTRYSGSFANRLGRTTGSVGAPTQTPITGPVKSTPMPLPRGVARPGQRAAAAPAKRPAPARSVPAKRPVANAAKRPAPGRAVPQKKR